MGTTVAWSQSHQPRMQLAVKEGMGLNSQAHKINESILFTNWSDSCNGPWRSPQVSPIGSPEKTASVSTTLSNADAILFNTLSFFVRCRFLELITVFIIICLVHCSYHFQIDLMLSHHVTRILSFFKSWHCRLLGLIIVVWLTWCRFLFAIVVINANSLLFK